MKLKRLSRFAAAAAISTLAASAGIAVSAPSAFAASPTASISPSTNLTDGQTVNLTGSGFDANTPIQVIECKPNPQHVASDCDGLTGQSGPALTTDATGSFSNVPILVYTLPGSADSTPPITCDVSHACVMYVGENKTNITASPEFFVPLSFQGPPATYNNVSSPTPQGPIGVLAGGTGSIAVNYGTANDSYGKAETITGNTTVTAQGAHGTATGGPAGTFSYQETDAALNASGGTDAFTVAGAAVSCGPTEANGCSGTAPTGNVIVVNVTINPKPAGLQTATTAPAAPGNTTIQVQNKSGMNAGDQLQITDPTGGHAITTTFVSDPPGTITINPAIPAGFTYPAGSLVTDTTAAAVSTGGTLSQIVQIPVAGGTITMSQASTQPTDVLKTLNNQILGSGAQEACAPPATSGPAIGKHVLTGEPFFACGSMSPLTVINARGNGAQWSITGVITDFVDGSGFAGTCDTKGNYSQHCIPAGNFQWGPVAAVGSDLVPGDVGNVSAGPALANVNFLAAGACTSNALSRYSVAPNGVKCITGSEVQSAVGGGALSTGWVAGESPAGFGLLPNVGLNGPPAATLCSAVAGTSGGTFVCGANLEVAVPASAAASNTPYQATLTLTLA